tara:strand:+ start:116 stop:343 length:228 start_codon:yes stop_codon:yes gene_type:complete
MFNRVLNDLVNSERKLRELIALEKEREAMIAEYFPQFQRSLDDDEWAREAQKKLAKQIDVQISEIINKEVGGKLG